MNIRPLLLGLLLSAPLWAGNPPLTQHTRPAWFTAAPQSLKASDPAVSAVLYGRPGAVRFTPRGAAVGASVTAQGKRQVTVFQLGSVRSQNKQAAAPLLDQPNGGRFNDLRGNGAVNQLMYEQLAYRNVQPGVDEVWRANGATPLQLILKPGADPAGLIMETGASHLQLNPNGGLTAQLNGAQLTLAPPTAHQLVNGARVAIAVRFVVQDQGRFAFGLEEYDTRRELFLDPGLTWSGYLGGYGGAGNEHVHDMVVDVSGNLYTVGETPSGGFPVTAGAYDLTYGGDTDDAFVTKLNPDGSIAWSTLLGGNGRDVGTGIAVDDQGRAHVAGYTNATDFLNPANTNLGLYPTDDIFAVILSADGSGLEMSKRLGGSDRDWAHGIALGPNNTMAIAGETESSDFPTVNADDPGYNGQYDTVVISINTTTGAVNFSTYFGGSDDDVPVGVALDSSGKIFVAGATQSDNLPTTSGAWSESDMSFQDIYAARYSPTGVMQMCTYFGSTNTNNIKDMTLDSTGNLVMVGNSRPPFPVTEDAYEPTPDGSSVGFITKMNANGTALVYSSWFENGGTNSVDAVYLDEDDNMYMAGHPKHNFDATPGAYDENSNSTYDAFVARLNSTGQILDFASFLGGDGDEMVHALTVDSSGRIYVGGMTESADFPTHAAADAVLDGESDAFVTAFTPDASGLHYSTFLGGGAPGSAHDVVADNQGFIYVTGSEDSSFFPTTTGAYDTSANGHLDAYVTKMRSSDGTIVYATLLGGSEADEGLGLHVDDSGSAWLTGSTRSSDFPTTPGAWDSSYAGITGLEDAFVTRLSPAGDSLLYSTYLGGAHLDIGRRIHVSSAGLITIAGQTRSQDFPLAGTPFGTWFGITDIFVTQINPSGDSLAYSSYLGGNAQDDVTAMVVDDNGRIFLAGHTFSSTFPFTAGAYDTTGPIQAAWDDGFLLKLSSDGSALDFSTFLGGASFDRINDLVLDASGKPVVAGFSRSSDFPTTTGVYDETDNGTDDAFVSRFSADGSTLEVSTLLGGDNHDYATGLAMDAAGRLYVSGYTGSDDFPTTPDAHDPVFDGSGYIEDAFVSRLSADFTTLDYSTYLGGGDDDIPSVSGVALDDRHTFFVVGYTESADFATTGGVVDDTQNGHGGGFISAFNFCTTAAAITQQPQDVIACDGAAATLSIRTDITAGVSFQWRKDGVAIGGATSNDHTIGVVSAADAAVYDCVVTDGCGTIISNSISLSLATGFQIDTTPQDTVFCEGEAVELSIGVSSNEPLSYQWYRDNTPINGATAAQLTLTNAGAADAATYRCDVTGLCETVPSNTATLRQASPVTITDQPESAVFCVGDDVTLSVTATNDDPFTYQWYKDDAAITGATAAQLDLTDLASSDAGSYRCEMIGLCGSLSSSDAILEEVTPLSISTQPLDTAFCAGDKVSLSVTAAGMGPFSYQWLKDGLPINGAVTAQLTLNAAVAEDAGLYRCDITDMCDTLSSADAALILNPPVTITTQPADVTYCEGDNLTLTVAASGDQALTYQWYKDDAALPGETDALLVFNNATAAAQGDYRCQVTGACQSISSATATLSAVPGFTITTQPLGDSFCDGESRTLSVTVDGSVSYQWFKDNTALPGETAAAMTLDNLSAVDEGDYHVEVGTVCNTVVSQTAALVWHAPVQILSQPQGGTACPSDPWTVEVEAAGDNATFQWFKDNNELTGETAAVLTLPAIETGDEGVYFCRITGPCDSLDSDNAVLVVESPFQLSTQPLSQIFCPDQAVTLTAAAQSDQSLSYQWFKDGQAVPGAESNQLVLAAAGVEDAGDYTCLVSSQCFQVESQTAQLSVGFDTAMTPGDQPQGLDPAVFEVAVLCGTDVTVNWVANPPTPLVVDGARVTLEVAPLESTTLTATVTDELGREQELTAQLLVAESTGYEDYNNDGCNSIQDVWSLGQTWGDGMIADPNGDGVIDIRDLLFIPVTDPPDCPQN